MKTPILATLFAFVPLALHASPYWQFDPAISVTGQAKQGIYHHLDSAGRRSIALSGDRVAITWEDNHGGQPQVYFAAKRLADAGFQPPLLISRGKEAYEPAIAGTADNRFILVWEEDGAIFSRAVSESGYGETIRVSSGNLASHASIASWNGKTYAAWREKRGPYPNIHVTELTIGPDNRLSTGQVKPIEIKPVPAPQLYPSLAVGAAGIAVAWEDRREGHTRLLYSHSPDGQRFTEPANLNEFYSNRNAYDKGNGVTRVSLACFDDDEIVAAWMDKRRGKKGYGIFAALGYGGGAEYGPNEKVQGAEGDALPHYNPSVAGNSEGRLIVAWDDYRKETSDIWLSTYSDEMTWSEDFTPPVSSGPGEQSNPSIAMDEAGNLHLAWIHRADMDRPSQLMYAFGKQQ